MDEVICENQYGRYSVPLELEHRPAVRLVKAGKVYEPKTIAFMRTQARRGDIIHAGTFFGDFIPALSDALFKGARLWAFEPNPASFAHAQRTIALNEITNVTLTRAALSEKPGTLHFRTHAKGAPLGGHAHLTDGPGAGVIDVPAMALDTAVPSNRRISILQLDVEGHEVEALLGARRIIETWKPILILEDFNRLAWLRDAFDVTYDRVSQVHGNRVLLPKGRTLSTP